MRLRPSQRKDCRLPKEEEEEKEEGEQKEEKEKEEKEEKEIKNRKGNGKEKNETPSLKKR